MSKIIAITSQKGGSGKTTLTCNLWAALRERDVETLLVDADPQGSLSVWARRCDEAPLVALDARGLLRLRERDDLPELVLIDCPPARGEIARAAIAVCDLALVPVRQTPTDLATLGDSLDLIAHERQRRPVRGALVLSQTFSRFAMGPEIEEALRGIVDVQLLDARTSHRVAYPYADAEGVGVVDYEPKGRAAEEIRAITTETLALLEGLS